jgi:hypothetical protein
MGVNGKDIGPFTVHFTIAATPTWQNADQSRLEMGTTTRASGMTINWTPGASVYNILITGSSYSDGTGQTGAAFECFVPSNLGTFTVPAQTMLALPGASFTEIDFRPVLPSQNFTASGLTLGIMNFEYQTSIFGVQFQ